MYNMQQIIYTAVLPWSSWPYKEDETVPSGGCGSARSVNNPLGLPGVGGGAFVARNLW